MRIPITQMYKDKAVARRKSVYILFWFDIYFKGLFLTKMSFLHCQGTGEIIVLLQILDLDKGKILAANLPDKIHKNILIYNREVFF